MSVEDSVADLKAKALRMHAIAQIVETFNTPADRKSFVMGMYECNAISCQAAELLIEAFGLEAA